MIGQQEKIHQEMKIKEHITNMYGYHAVNLIIKEQNGELRQIVHQHQKHLKMKPL